MLNYIDSILAKITMYRLMLYFLMALVVIAVILSAFGLVYFSPISILITALTLLVLCWSMNLGLAKLFRIPANVESVYITALILSLIITPVDLSEYVSALPFLLIVSVIAMGSKFLLAWKGKHIFNPAAIAVLITSFSMATGASWWVGDGPLAIPIILGGLLVTRKLQRFDLVLSFVITSLAVIFVSNSLTLTETLSIYLLHSQMLFFAMVMLTEPLTTPPTRLLRIIYGVIVAALFAGAFRLSSMEISAELALVVGNIFSYLVSPKIKLLLTFKSKQEIGTDTFEYIFVPNHKLDFKPGQYLEWTLGHHRPDTRGNRRFFTIASSPTEPEIRLGVKFYPESSSFKQTLKSLTPGSQVLAGQLAGEFTLPKNPSEKLVFIAGGIGVTPFRSMVKYIMDKGERRDITVFYSTKPNTKIAYQELLSQADSKLNIKTNYTEKVTAEIIQSQCPDFRERTFYISGPHGMVVAYEKSLQELGIRRNKIKIDFFPGYA